MPLITPDTGEAQDYSTPVKPGTYKSKILDVDFKTSDAGNPMIVPRFEFNEGDKRRVRKAFLVINGEGAYGFDQLLRAAGFGQLADIYKDKAIPANQKPPFNTDDLVGKEVQIIVEEQIIQKGPNAGKKSDGIKSYLPS